MEEEGNVIFKLEGGQVCIICDSDEKKPKLGTGFVFLRPDWVVTAAHVVLGEFGEPRKNLYAQFATTGNSVFPIQVVAVHKENDIALLEISRKPYPTNKPLFPGYDDLSASIGLICCGYRPSHSQERNVITVSLAKVYQKSFRERERIETLLEFESGGIEGGSSGGPIFGDGGVVLGILINVFSNEDEPNKRFARATSILNLMEAIKIDYNDEIFHSF